VRALIISALHLIDLDNTVQSLKRVKAITGQKQGSHTIHTVFFITVRTVMTLLTYCNEENRMNRVVSLLLPRNSFEPF
jgi:hypothetical protein